MFSREAATSNHSIHTAKSVQDFLDYLIPSANHWNSDKRSAKRGDLAYRGQASSYWPLVPKAFRAGQPVGYGPNAPIANPTRVTCQSRIEFQAVQEFVRAADASGLQITEAGSRLLIPKNSRDIFNDPNWEYNWPQEEFLETLALAQHHGVPTRLLDFTEDPLIGAYFSASSAWDMEKRRRLTGRNRRYLAVWVIDLRFIRFLNGIVGRYPERIGEVRVPRVNNPFLNAQLGFFLIDRGANDVMTRGESMSIDNATAARARFWHSGGRLARKEIKWFDELPIRQVRLRTTHTAALLRELENRGITKGSVMPSLDRVVESLEFQRSIPSSIPSISDTSTH